MRARAVIDASVIVSWFLLDESNGKYEFILNNIDKIKIHVPSIFQYEFINILLNAQKSKRIEHSTAVKVFIYLKFKNAFFFESDTFINSLNVK